MVKILTWNVAALRPLPPKLPKQSLASFFSQHNADIVCLQEHKISDYSKLTPDLAVVEGYDSFFSFSGKGYAGVVTFVKKGGCRWWTDNPFNVALDGAATSLFPSSSKQSTVDPDTDPDTSIGRCILTDHGDFLLLNIYAPNAGRGPEFLVRKLEFYGHLSECVRKWHCAGRKVIVTGDINTAHNEVDIYNPKKYSTGTGFLDEERAWITQFLKDRDMVDAFRAVHAQMTKYSFWDQRRQQRPLNNGWRIDVFYVSSDLFYPLTSPAPDGAADSGTDAAALKSGSEILNEVQGSDHCPITLTLPHVKLSTTYECKNASSNRPSLNPRKISGFFSKSVRGQVISGKRKGAETDDEEDEAQKKVKS